MVDSGTSLAIGIVATFVPLIIGLVLPKRISKTWQSPVVLTWLAAFSSGAIFWFFIDVMGEAAQLDINLGFGGDYTHIVLALSFVVGIAVLFGLERRFPPARNVHSTEQSVQMKSVAADITSVVAAVAALGIGFHAFGEGMVIGANLSGVLTNIYSGIAYVLHKLLEGFVVGSFAIIAAATRPRNIGAFVSLAGVPTVIGLLVGLLTTWDSTYLFALGGAGAVYIEMRLIPLLARSGRFSITIVAFLLGFYAMYSAGLFHSVGSG